MSATNKRIEAISKGKRYSVKKRVPIVSVVGTRGLSATTCQLVRVDTSAREIKTAKAMRNPGMTWKVSVLKLRL